MSKIIGNGLPPEPSPPNPDTRDDRRKSAAPAPEDDAKPVGDPREEGPPLEANKIIGNG